MGRDGIFTESLADQASAAQQRTLVASWVLFALDALLLLIGYVLIELRVLRPVFILARQCREIAQNNYSTQNNISCK